MIHTHLAESVPDTPGYTVPVGCHSTWQLSRSLSRRHRLCFDASPARLFSLFSTPAARRCKPACMISVQCYWSSCRERYAKFEEENTALVTFYNSLLLFESI